MHRSTAGKVYVKYFLVKDAHGVWCRERRVDALWTDVAPLRHAAVGERTGFPTQKPRALLERIIRCATKPGGDGRRSLRGQRDDRRGGARARAARDPRRRGQRGDRDRARAPPAGRRGAVDRSVRRSRRRTARRRAPARHARERRAPPCAPRRAERAARVGDRSRASTASRSAPRGTPSASPAPSRAPALHEAIVEARRGDAIAVRVYADDGARATNRWMRSRDPPRPRARPRGVRVGGGARRRAPPRRRRRCSAFVASASSASRRSRSRARSTRASRTPSARRS